MTPPLPYIPSAAIAQAFIVALGMVCNDHSVAQVPEPVLGEVVEATVFYGDDRLFEEGAPMSTDELEWLLAHQLGLHLNSFEIQKSQPQSITSQLAQFFIMRQLVLALGVMKTLL